MDLFKELSEKAKNAAKIVGEKSSDVLEIGKLRIQISNLENDIRRAKTEIGQIYYNAYANGNDISNERILSICKEIEVKYSEIEEIKHKIDSINL